jgi:hypothetical protein
MRCARGLRLGAGRTAPDGRNCRRRLALIHCANNASLLRKVRKVNGSECTRGSQNAGRNASKIRELFQRRLANDWAKNGYFQYSVTRTVCEVLGTPRAVAIMGSHESGLTNCLEGSCYPWACGVEVEPLIVPIRVLKPEAAVVSAAFEARAAQARIG